MATPRCSRAARLLCQSRRVLVSPSVTAPIPYQFTRLAHRQAGRSVRKASPSPSSDAAVARLQRLREPITLEGVPLSRFEVVVASNNSPFTLASAAEYYSVAHKFVDEARSSESPLQVDISKLDGVSAPVLHDAACILSSFYPQRILQPVVAAMLMACSRSGHDPSTITLTSAIIQANLYGQSPQLKPVEERFKRIVTAAKNPDALTVEGMRRIGQGSPESAIPLLNHALSLNDGQDFEWKALCRYAIAQADVKLNRFDKAIPVLEELAAEGLPIATVPLAHALRSRNRTLAKSHYEYAAGFYDEQAIRALVEMETEDAAATKDSASKTKHLKLAAEWSRLLDKKATV